MSFKIALTGLIGAGKSTAADVFATLGIPCYYTDNEAKRLMTGVLKDKIVSLLGDGAYDKSGNMDRKYIAGKIFSDKSLLYKINQIVHPAVIEDFNRWADSSASPYVIVETALLLESGFRKSIDKVIVVTADMEERIARAMKRDHADRRSIMNRISSQGHEDELISIADFIIDNSENSLIIPRILEIHKIILSLSFN